MFDEKIVQISGNKILTTKGRIFEAFLSQEGHTIWNEIELPIFNKNTPENQLPIGKSKFFEPETNKEKFDNAKNINDLLH